eukprot:CAMPEP_0178998364 /NCGR_PEP_ID=MMETSP0795-20121207/9474_1 /TAXON_ID=88552 /ORGANISM="Amoebophrya sp., Strain Ameob2" /LENGTH=656 /DNA_ID=CAMNT_0020691039 /DNA_START=308 /DNA_END=2275 /DNA_ORIENTATION=+
MRRVRDFQRETTDEAGGGRATRREDGGFEQWVIGLEMKDPVIGAKIVELAEVEKIIRRIYQVEVKGLLAAEKRVLHAEKTKMETTKQYMQEVLFLREKSRSGVPFDVLEGLDHLSEEDTRMFFDAGISLPPGVRQVLDLIIQEKVNDAADRLQKKLLRGELDGLQGSSLRSTRTKGFRTESESETEKVAVKLRDDSPDLRDPNFPTPCKECADLKAERDQLVTTVNQLQKENRKLESEKHTVAEEVCRLRLELQDTVDVIDAEKKQIADRYEAEMDQIQKEKFLLEEALREMKQGAQGFQSARLNELETLVEKLENEIKSLKEGESNGYALRAQIGEQKAIVAAQKLEIGTLTDELAQYRNAEKELLQKLEQADRTLFATQKQLLKALGQGDDAGDGGQSNIFANSMAAELMARIAEDSMQVHDRLYVDAYKRRERQRLLWEERAPQIETKWLEAQAVLKGRVPRGPAVEERRPEVAAGADKLGLCLWCSYGGSSDEGTDHHRAVSLRRDEHKQRSLASEEPLARGFCTAWDEQYKKWRESESSATITQHSYERDRDEAAANVETRRTAGQRNTRRRILVVLMRPPTREAEPDDDRSSHHLLILHFEFLDDDVDFALDHVDSVSALGVEVFARTVALAEVEVSHLMLITSAWIAPG